MLEAEDAGSPEPCTCLSLKPREGQRPGPFWEREPQRVGGGVPHIRNSTQTMHSSGEDRKNCV